MVILLVMNHLKTKHQKILLQKKNMKYGVANFVTKNLTININVKNTKKNIVKIDLVIYVVKKDIVKLTVGIYKN